MSRVCAFVSGAHSPPRIFHPPPTPHPTHTHMYTRIALEKCALHFPSPLARLPVPPGLAWPPRLPPLSAALFLCPVIVRSSLVPFSCSTREGVAIPTLNAEPSIKCTPDDPVYRRMRVIGGVSIVAYGAGLPALFAYFLGKHRAAIRADQALRAKGEGETSMTNPHIKIRRRFRKLCVAPSRALAPPRALQPALTTLSRTAAPRTPAPCQPVALANPLSGACVESISFFHFPKSNSFYITIHTLHWWCGESWVGLIECFPGPLGAPCSLPSLSLSLFPKTT
jgi:hypothetical protein